MALGPGPFGRGKAAPVAEQEVRQAMPSAQEIGANIFTTAQEVARRLFLVAGNVNGGERPRPMEHRELTGIAAVGFDAIARSPGNQRGGNHVTGNLVGGKCALQLEAARPGFIAAAHRPLAVEALDKAEKRRTIRCQGMQRRRALSRE